MLTSCLACMVLMLAACSAGARNQPASSMPGSLTALPSPPQVAVGDLPGRWTSQSTLHWLTLEGNEHTMASGNADLGSATTLTAPAGGHAYAIYRLGLGGAPLDGVDIAFTLLPPTHGEASECWVGVPDYSSGKWTWQRWYELMADILRPQGSFYNCQGETYIALVAPRGSSFEIDYVQAQLQGLAVGPGQAYSRIEDAYEEAVADDNILVFPQAGNAPYQQPALQVYKAGIHFAGIPASSGDRVILDGTGYNYTGAGPTPRALFQFNPGADGCTVSGFSLQNATNDSHNGAGVRINQANNITVRFCEITGCDMGMMSNGSGPEATGANQLVEHCVVHANGSFDHPGYNHNFYMGGHSFTLRASHVYGSLTGQNVKSRAHINVLDACYIHDSANRELDLVDGGEDTALAGSHSIVRGCIIAKAQSMTGNKHTMHFGQDIGGEHNGTLYLVNNTILTPYITAIIQLSAPGARCQMYNNLIWDYGTDQTNQHLLYISGGATASSLSGSHNWLPYGMDIAAGHGLDPLTTWVQAAGTVPPFENYDAASPLARSYRLGAFDAGICDVGLDFSSLPLPPGTVQLSLAPRLEFTYPACATARPAIGAPDLGAYEYAP